jgi:hypothetical protein
MTTKPDLDALLAMPLAPIADEGFSGAVEVKMAAQDQSFAWFELAAGVMVLALVALVVPVARLTAPFEAIAINLALSWQFVVACAAIALTHAALRLLPD